MITIWITMPLNAAARINQRIFSTAESDVAARPRENNKPARLRETRMGVLLNLAVNFSS
jgi:hypothetical protein